LGSQDGEITAFAAIAGKKMAVVVVTPGAVLTPWRGNVSAVVTPMMPGQQYGNAIASILFGDVNPSGKLAITFPVTENVWCAFFDRNLRSGMPLVPAPVRLKLLQACDQWHSSRLFHSSYRFTLQIASKH
jgi:hypothetical protein